jgi:spore coat polysaccharide biosynthesis protein SpsF (cytidylyltransferase family)
MTPSAPTSPNSARQVVQKLRRRDEDFVVVGPVVIGDQVRILKFVALFPIRFFETDRERREILLAFLCQKTNYQAGVDPA